ncbi:hypothetical protein X743_20920 [Mesorhizobium sp. LNHC252B00]|nr:hypothetical protein X743_20920 [Mesorhizobium sp. LNHC252B00]
MINSIAFYALEKPLCTERRCQDYRGNDKVQFSMRGARELGQIVFGGEESCVPEPMDPLTGAGRMPMASRQVPMIGHVPTNRMRCFWKAR